MSAGELEDRVSFYCLHSEIAGNRSVRTTVWMEAQIHMVDNRAGQLHSQTKWHTDQVGVPAQLIGDVI